MALPARRHLFWFVGATVFGIFALAYRRIGRSRRVLKRAVHRPPGVANVGNTCYLGSALQLLSSSPVLRRHFDRFGHVVAAELNALLSQLNSPAVGKPILSPNALIRAISKDGFNAMQQDSHEFLIALLRLFQRPSNPGLAAAYSRERLSPFQLNPVSGYIVNEFCCPNSAAHGIKSFFSMEPMQIVTVYEGSSVAKELFGQCRLPDYRMSSCKCGLGAVRIRRRLVLPTVLIVHNALLGAAYRKGRHVLQLHLQLQDKRYELRAFIVHIGPSGHAGHYVAYRRMGGIWWLCNDAQVRQVSADALQLCSPYLLLYEQDH